MRSKPINWGATKLLRHVKCCLISSVYHSRECRMSKRKQRGTTCIMSSALTQLQWWFLTYIMRSQPLNISAPVCILCAANMWPVPPRQHQGIHRRNQRDDSAATCAPGCQWAMGEVGGGLSRFLWCHCCYQPTPVQPLQDSTGRLKIYNLHLVQLQVTHKFQKRTLG